MRIWEDCESKLQITKIFHQMLNFRGHHHMGGTRMFENSKYGVVDSNCEYLV